MHYFSKITGVRETESGTDLLLQIPNEKVASIIARRKVGDTVDAEVRINDGRTISTEQRKKIYALVRDICDYTGDDPEYMKEYMKYDYCATTGGEHFSLSSCSVTIAREFISHLIDFVLRENIPLADMAINRAEDIDRYLWGCIKYRRCSITGRSGADIHHCTGSRVGMGRDRQSIDHSNLELIALSRDWHNRVHSEGEYEIFKDYKIYGIKVDRETLKELGLQYEDID